MKSENFKDNIDDYLMGRLNPKDLLLFQQELEKDVDLAKEVSLRRTFIEGLEAFGRSSLKEELQEIHKEVIAKAQTSPAKRHPLLPYIAAAASVLLLVFAIYKMNSSTGLQSTDDLYAAYFSPYDISATQRSGADELDLRIETLYKNKNYSDVLPLLEEKLASLDTKPSNLLLAKGIALLESNEPEKALLNFQKITTNKDFNFEDEVRWYTALAYLKMGDVPAARTSIQKLIDVPSADHHESAKDLFEELSSRALK